MIATPSLPSMITMTVVDAGNATRQFQLKSEQGVFLGTSANCGLPLSGAGVSDMHCYVKSEDGKLWIEDWMSKAGTVVNGSPICSRVALNLDDVIQVGPNKITLQGTTQAQRSPEVRPAATPDVAQADGELPAVSPHGNGVSANDDIDCQYICNPSCDLDEASLDHQPSETCFDSSFFEIDDEENCDGETVALLRAEIRHLQSALAQRDAERFGKDQEEVNQPPAGMAEPDDVLERMQELIDEANRSDERVSLLEEILRAANDANRAEQEERSQLEAWVDDIEHRVGQREEEHQAEVDALRQRLEESNEAQGRLIQQLRQAASKEGAPDPYQDHFKELQHSHQKLQDELAESRRQCASLQQRLEQKSEERQQALRQERAKLAEEHARVAQLRLEVSSRFTPYEESPQPDSNIDTEADHRIKVLREHLREIHDQERKEAKSASLVSRLAGLWQRVQ